MKDIRIVLIKIYEQQAITMEEIYDFIEQVWKKLNPSKIYKYETVSKAIRLNLGPQIVSSLVSQIEQNPDLFGFTIVKLLDQNKNVLKIEIQ